MMEPTNTFRTRLKQYFEAEGLDPAQFSPKIGRSVDTVKAYLAGTNVPKVDVILEIGRQYPHWSIKYLLTGVGEPFKSQKQAVPTEGPTNEKGSILKWLMVRNRVHLDLATLPLDGFQILYEDLVEEVGELLAETQHKMQEIDRLTKANLDL